MATKLYFHNAATADTGTLPSGSSLSAKVSTGDASGAFTNRSMDGNLGAGQTSVANTTVANTSSQGYAFRRFCSLPIAAQTIASQTLTLSVAGSENNAASNFQMTCGVYLWRPSTGALIGVICEVSTITQAEVGTTQTAESGTGTSLAQTAAAGDIIVVEVWRDFVAQVNSTSRTNTFFYDGGTEASTTDEAAFIQFANTLTMLVTAHPASQAVVIV